MKNFEHDACECIEEPEEDCPMHGRDGILSKQLRKEMLEQLRYEPLDTLHPSNATNASLVASVHNAMKRLDKTVMVLVPFTPKFQPLINALEDGYKVLVKELYSGDYVAVIGSEKWIKVETTIAQIERYPLVRDEESFFPAKRPLGLGSYINDYCSECDMYSVNHGTGVCENPLKRHTQASKYPELSFARLSDVNLQRCERWHPNGIESWSVSDWLMAMAGEAGEACNAGKKFRRLEDKLVGNHQYATDVEQALAEIGKELADTVIYADLVAQRLGLNLGSLIIEKFNEVSVRNNFPERL